MNHSIYALILFAGWTFLLVLVVFSYRGLRVLQGTAINAWPRGSKSTTDAGIITRIADAHANCLENLPIFAVLVLSAAALGQMDVSNKFAPFVFWARMGQTVVHLIGTEARIELDVEGWRIIHTPRSDNRAPDATLPSPATQPLTPKWNVDGMSAAIRELLGAMQTGAATVSSGETARRTVAISDAILQSAAQGNVRVPVAPAPWATKS